MKTKSCIHCGVIKPATSESFYQLPSGNLRGSCRECEKEKYARWYRDNKEQHNATAKIWQKKNREKVRGYFKKYRDGHPEKMRMGVVKRYGIDIETYEVLLKKQKGTCAICKKKCFRNLAVDHDHESKRVRGLLCSKCNTGLGLLGDSVDNIKRTLKYLNQYARDSRVIQ